jgi:hypothetical protein
VAEDPEEILEVWFVPNRNLPGRRSFQRERHIQYVTRREWDDRRKGEPVMLDPMRGGHYEVRIPLHPPPRR